MKIKFFLNDNDFVLHRVAKDNAHTIGKCQHFQVNGRHECFNYEADEIILDGIRIHAATLKVKGKTEIKAKASNLEMGMHFQFSGNSYSSFSHSKGRVHSKKGRQMLMAIPKTEFIETLVTEENLRVFQVNFSSERVKNSLQELYGKSSDVLFRLQKPNENVSISNDMAGIISQILNCPLKGDWKHLYYEAKVFELLSLQLCSLTSLEESSGDIPVGDIEKLYFAKELIETQLENPPSLQQLSKLCGLNEFKLKKGFRVLFDTSVYQYVLQTRVQKAKILLNSDHSISEVADLTGFSSASHFNCTFRRITGITPGQWRGKSHTSSF